MKRIAQALAELLGVPLPSGTVVDHRLRPRETGRVTGRSPPREQIASRISPLRLR